MPLRELPIWWWREVQAFAASITGHTDLATSADAFIVDWIDVGMAMLLRRERHIERRIGPLPLDQMGLTTWRQARRGAEKIPVIIRALSLRLLERDVELPLAAENDIGGALRYLIAELTPFSPDEVAWNWHPSRRDVANGKIWVRLTVLPIAATAPLRRLLAQDNVGIAQFVVTSPSGELQTFNPLGEARRDPRSATIWACLLVLGVIAILIPFAVQWVGIAQSEARIQNLEPSALAASAMARRLNPTRRDSGASSHQPVLSVLAALTETLPDDAWLSSLSIHGDVVDMTGEAADSATLIARLSKKGPFKNPTYTAPVTRTVNGRSDRFSIQTRVKP